MGLWPWSKKTKIIKNLSKPITMNIGDVDTSKSVATSVNNIKKDIEKLARGGSMNESEYNSWFDETITNGDTSALNDCLSNYYSVDINKFSGISEMKAATWKAIMQNTADPVVQDLKNLYSSTGVYQQGYEIRSNSYKMASLELSPTLTTGLTATSIPNKIGLTNSGEMLTLQILDNQIYNINIKRADWATYSTPPKNVTMVKSIDRTTESTTTHDSQIPTGHGGAYIIDIKTKEPYNNFLYRLYVKRDDLLGTLKEEDVYESDDPKFYIYSTAVRKALGQKKIVVMADRVDGTKAAFAYSDPKLSEDANLIKRYEQAIAWLKA